MRRRLLVLVCSIAITWAAIDRLAVAAPEQRLDYSRAFLDRHRKGRPFPQALTAPHQGVAEVRVAH